MFSVFFFKVSRATNRFSAKRVSRSLSLWELTKVIRTVLNLSVDLRPCVSMTAACWTPNACSLGNTDLQIRIARWKTGYHSCDELNIVCEVQWRWLDFVVLFWNKCYQRSDATLCFKQYRINVLDYTIFYEKGVIHKL